ncbi:MAG: O-antigen ligase family protein [Candidatus Rokubacteria bacterium]|nr:O-antigen ligase family protein [Candidatus Rokubacteria bacterium]
MIRSGEAFGRVQHLDRLGVAVLYALLLWAPLANGAYRGWPLAIAEVLALLGLLLWVLRMLAARRLEWRRTALDLPLALLTALVLLQLVLGNGPLADWALAPPGASLDAPAELPAPFWTLGTVSPAQTLQSLLLMLTYAGAYVLVVNQIRTRRQLDGLVRVLLLLGGLLAFVGLIGYLSGEAWLVPWHDAPLSGRLSGTFVNPDHFATWLAVLVCLGLGYLAARSRPRPDGTPLLARLSSREGREEAMRRYLPSIGVGLMALAVVFTLSRGGVVSLLLALVVLAALLGALGRTRWTLVLVATLLAVTLGYAAWIGLEPFLARVRQTTTYAGRWIQSLTTVPMLTDFPLLGVGLGAYKDIYFRYQPTALDAGKVYFPYAHNDLLQLAVELGPIGAALCLWAAWRVGRDLLRVHLFGLGRCPAGAGEDEWARRRDPFSVGIALGSAGGVLALVFHSGFDFGARIPANGILAAACLGIATVALHTRFGPEEHVLSEVRSRDLARGTFAPAAATLAALGAALILGYLVVRPALVETNPTALAAGDARWTDRWDARLLAARARSRAERASQVWMMSPGQLEERRREALGLLSGAIEDYRAALSLTPSDPFLHERLARVYSTAAQLSPSEASPRITSAVAHLRRGIALAPENPFLYRSLAALAVTHPEPLLSIGLQAARDATRRDPTLLPDLVDRFLPLRLGESEWAAFVPDAALDRLQLGSLLEARGLIPEARVLYARAVEIAAPGEQPLARWILAKLLIRARDLDGALAALDPALRADPANPELQLARAEALAARGDPSALDAYRTAVARAEAAARRPGGDALPFPATDPRVRSLVVDRLGDQRAPPTRYQSALARHLAERRLWEQALEQWEAVLAVAPRDAAAHFGRGMALDALGRGDRALEAYRTAVSLDGRNARFRLRLAERLWATDQYFQAINEWRMVADREPLNLEARLALARAYLKIGERVAALREYRRAFEIAPDNLEARRGLERLGATP